MKTLYIAIFTLMAAAATAAPIDVINSYRVGGSFYRSSVSLHDHNPSAFNEVTSVGSCAETVNILKNTDKPTIAIWDYLSHEIADSNTCKIDDDMFITTYVSAYYSICSVKPYADLDHLLTGKAQVGAADWHTVKTAAAATLKGIGSNSEVVAYSTSKEYMLALEIGEIDYIYTNRIKPGMNCVLSNDPTSEIKHTGDLYDHPFATFSSDIGIIGVNVDKDEVQTLIIDASTNSEWSKKFPYYKNGFGKMFRGEQLKTVKGLLSEF